jgi:hypothetical protein
VNTRATTAKLRRLLRDFAFSPAREVLATTGVTVSRRAA